jgi:hypothetical protein
MLQPGAIASASDALKVQRIFGALQPSDADMIRLLSAFKDEDVASAVAGCSPAKASNQKMIGVLTWFCVEFRPASLKRFPLYLKQMYDSDKLEEAALLEWHKAAPATALAFLPEGASCKAEDVKACQTSCDAFITWLSEAEDEDDDDEEED